MILAGIFLFVIIYMLIVSEDAREEVITWILAGGIVWYIWSNGTGVG